MARILIIDDETNIRLMVRLALQSCGHEVQTAADGPTGLNTFADGSGWDVVLLDQRMPGLDGLAVLREMRRREPDARVVMVTAFGTVDLAASALRSGAASFLRKPFTLEVLRGAVQAALQPCAATPEHTAERHEGHGPMTGFGSINGYRIENDMTGASARALLGPCGPGLQHTFMVRSPDGEVQPCRVVLPLYLVELVKAHADRETIPESDDFWRWLGEESLANYLWQHAALPPGQTLQVDEMTSAMRRWIDVVLTA